MRERPWALSVSVEAAWTRVENAEVVAVGLTGGIGAGQEHSAGDSSGSRARSPCRPTRSCTLSIGETTSEKRCAATSASRCSIAEHGVDRRRVGRGGARAAGAAALAGGTHPSAGGRGDRARIGEAPSGSVVVCEVPLLFEYGYARTCSTWSSPSRQARDRRRQRSIHDFDLDMFARVRGSAGLERAEGGAAATWSSSTTVTVEELRRSCARRTNARVVLAEEAR